jgi:glycerol uptake facilitator-like aquaporin
MREGPGSPNLEITLWFRTLFPWFQVPSSLVPQSLGPLVPAFLLCVKFLGSGYQRTLA